MTLVPVIGEKETFQIIVVPDIYPEQFPDFPLVPVGPGPDFLNRINLGALVFQPQLEVKPDSLLNGGDIIDHFKSFPGIDAAYIADEVNLQAYVILDSFAERDQVTGILQQEKRLDFTGFQQLDFIMKFI
jgi:hypothetical protein